MHKFKRCNLNSGDSLNRIAPAYVPDSALVVDICLLLWFNVVLMRDTQLFKILAIACNRMQKSLRKVCCSVTWSSVIKKEKWESSWATVKMLCRCRQCARQGTAKDEGDKRQRRDFKSKLIWGHQGLKCIWVLFVTGTDRLSSVHSNF